MTEQEQKAFTAMREALESSAVCIQLMSDGPSRASWGDTLDIIDAALTAANAVSHLNPETTPVPEGGAITSESAANAVSEQAQGDAWKPDFEHLANEWADAATNGPTILDNVRDGIYSFEKAKEMMAADFAHCREVGAKVRSANPQATEPAWIAASDRLPEEDKRVLVWYRGHVSTTSLWRGSFITDSAEQPTHWMPLPAAPEAHHE